MAREDNRKYLSPTHDTSWPVEGEIHLCDPRLMCGLSKAAMWSVVPLLVQIAGGLVPLHSLCKRIKQ